MSAMPDGVLRDPVCGMSVSSQSSYRYQGGGTEFWFCSARCRDRFADNPKAFLRSVDLSVPSSGENAYTCPMHPDVWQTGPDSCPKCGMTREPVTPTPRRAVEWTCPMHPEIVRTAPGNCPKCGMALEPRSHGGAEEESAELRDMTRRFCFAAAVTVPLVLAVMSDMLAGRPISSLLSPRLRDGAKIT